MSLNSVRITANPDLYSEWSTDLQKKKKKRKKVFSSAERERKSLLIQASSSVVYFIHMGNNKPLSQTGKNQFKVYHKFNVNFKTKIFLYEDKIKYFHDSRLQKTQKIKP